MARNLDALAVIFPFEVGCYADTGLSVEFVGHPFHGAGSTPPPVRFDPGRPRAPPAGQPAEGRGPHRSPRFSAATGNSRAR